MYSVGLCIGLHVACRMLRCAMIAQPNWRKATRRSTSSCTTPRFVRSSICIALSVWRSPPLHTRHPRPPPPPPAHPPATARGQTGRPPHQRVASPKLARISMHMSLLCDHRMSVTPVTERWRKLDWLMTPYTGRALRSACTAREAVCTSACRVLLGCQSVFLCVRVRHAHSRKPPLERCAC